MKGGAGLRRATFGLAALAALAACDARLGTGQAPAPEPAAVAPPAPTAPPIPLEPSAQSAELKIYYQRLQNDLQARGLLRTDGGGPDTPFTDTMLARNFIRIALFDEYVADGTVLRPQQTVSRLRRWEQPIRMRIEFGDRVPADQRIRDRNSIIGYADRLSRITGHPISQTQSEGNFVVLVLTEDDRLGFEQRLRELVPGITESSVRTFVNLDRSFLCLALAFSSGGSASYSKTVVLIRAEHPDLLRLACVHEEIAQGMGLANDSPAARPSIFNDDEEFGLLTTHDELLLRMLYDRRFRTGMTAAEAAPIAREVAREYLEGQS